MNIRTENIILSRKNVVDIRVVILGNIVIHEMSDAYR